MFNQLESYRLSIYGGTFNAYMATGPTGKLFDRVTISIDIDGRCKEFERLMQGPLMPSATQTTALILQSATRIRE